MAKTPPSRECQPCTACCDGWLQIRVNGVPVFPGRPCPHSTGSGCDDYKNRPVDPCVHFICGWRMDASPLPESAARFGLMRRLLELPVCLFADLTEAERVYLGSQRHRLLAWCAEMTGWVAEQRAEGIALIATDEPDTDLPFPRLRAADFAALMVLDELLRQDRDGVGDGSVDEDQIGHAVAEIQARYPRAMTTELKAEDAMRLITAELLVALDLLRPADRPGLWRLTPAAARFRNPAVVSVTARLDEAVE